MPLDEAQRTSEQRKREALEALARGSAAGVEGYERADKSIAGTQQTAMDQALGAAVGRNAPAAMQGVIESTVRAPGDLARQSLATARGTFEADVARQGVANTNYFDQVAGAVPLVRAAADSRIGFARAQWEEEQRREAERQAWAREQHEWQMEVLRQQEAAKAASEAGMGGTYPGGYRTEGQLQAAITGRADEIAAQMAAEAAAQQRTTGHAAGTTMQRTAQEAREGAAGRHLADDMVPAAPAAPPAPARMRRGAQEARDNAANRPAAAPARAPIVEAPTIFGAVAPQLAPGAPSAAPSIAPTIAPSIAPRLQAPPRAAIDPVAAAAPSIDALSTALAGRMAPRGASQPERARLLGAGGPPQPGDEGWVDRRGQQRQRENMREHQAANQVLEEVASTPEWRWQRDAAAELGLDPMLAAGWFRPEPTDASAAVDAASAEQRAAFFDQYGVVPTPSQQQQWVRGEDPFAEETKNVGDAAIVRAARLKDENQLAEIRAKDSYKEMMAVAQEIIADGQSIEDIIYELNLNPDWSGQPRAKQVVIAEVRPLAVGRNYEPEE